MWGWTPPETAPAPQAAPRPTTNATASPNDGHSTYTYSPRGTLATRTTGATTEDLDFDAFDRLVKQGTNNYSYDALDRVANRNQQRLTYSGAGNELATDGATAFARGPGDELIATKTGSTARVTMSDQHDDVVAGLDPTTGQVAASTGYAPSAPKPPPPPPPARSASKATTPTQTPAAST